MNTRSTASALLAPDITEAAGASNFGPNWFASAMGTGIIANAGVLLPFHVRGLHTFCFVIWLVASLTLVALVIASVTHYVRSPHMFRRYSNDPQMIQFYGAPPMAILVVGTGAVLVARNFLGIHLAVDIDWTLWVLGTLLGLITAVIVPFRLFLKLEVRPDSAFGGWLLPIVPPLVAATSGAILLPYMATQTERATMLYGCYALFGMSMVSAFIIISLIWSRLALHGTSKGTRVPTLWIVLGPLGSSVTTAGILGGVAHLAVASSIAKGMRVFSILYGVPIWGFAMLWTAIALALTVATIRSKMPFALTWWSFTFPVGVTVTGTIRLYDQTQLPAFKWASAVGYVALLCAWALVAVRTLVATRREGLLYATSTGPAPVAQKFL